MGFIVERMIHIMSKKGAIVIDMPTTCFECKFCHESSYDNRYKICGDNFCGIEHMEVNEYCELRSKPDWCPCLLYTSDAADD